MPDRGSTTSTPHWVKVTAVLVLLFGILHLTTHSVGGYQGHTPPSNGIEHGGQQP